MIAFRTSALLRIAIVVLVSWQVAAAQAATGAGDTLRKGPKVGETISLPFVARDQNGAVRDFASLKGERGLVLLFARSLDW